MSGNTGDVSGMNRLNLRCAVARRYRWGAYRMPLGLLLLALLCGGAALAQTPRPQLSVDPALETLSGRTVVLPARIVAVQDYPPNMVVIIRGLPVGAALDRGRSIELGGWTVDARKFDKVELQIPATVSGEFKVSFDIVINDEVVSTQQSLSLRIKRESIPAPAAQAPAPSAQQPASPQVSPPQATQANPSAGVRELAKGSELLKSGDIRAARLFLQRSAEAGNPQAALMLGSTYDPNTMRNLGVIGMDPDLKQAQFWYDEALRLGSPKANALLTELARLRQTPANAK